MTPSSPPPTDTVFTMINQREPEGPTLGVTPAACQRLRDLFHEEKQDNPEAQPALSLRVDAGGCSGFQYFMDIAAIPDPDAVLLTYDDVRVAIDEPSLDLLKGSYIDFAQNLMGSAFVVRNPNATSSCGCGNSFTVF